MSRAVPLVYLAPSVQEQARTIVGGCPENLIQDSIMRGQLRFESGRALIAGAGWEAVAVRAPGTIRRAPRAWKVLRVEPSTTKE
jgi:hypothetical protein